MSQRLRRLPLGLVVGAAATVIVGAAFLLGQTYLRGSANHPQIEMVRTAVSELDRGASPQSVLPSRTIDLYTSADPFVIVVDSGGAIEASSVTLGGSSTLPPGGVFDYVRAHGEDVVTWQPAPSVRSAIVVDSYDGGYVVAGRSLDQTEREESTLLWVASVAWVAAMIGAIALGLLRLKA